MSKGARDEIGNPPKPSWWDATWHEETEPEWRWDAAMPGSEQSCGCHIRRSDCEAILCPAHLADLNGAQAADRKGSA